MSKSEFDPPSYKDSVPSGQSLQHQVSTVRSQHIKYIVLSRILPVLSERAARGLSKTTVALIPQDIIPENGNRPFKLLGLADTHEPFSEIQLKDALDTCEFWEQKEVLNTLQELLTTELSTNSNFALPQNADIKEDPTILPPRPNAGRFSFFGRKSSASIPKAVVSKRPASPAIKVVVGTEDVCYRTLSDLGLYETLSQAAIIVRVTTK